MQRDYTVVRPDGDDWPDLMTGPEVAKLFRVDPKTVARWGKSGRLTAIRTPGNHLRYDRSEVRKIMESMMESHDR